MIPELYLKVKERIMKKKSVFFIIFALIVFSLPVKVQAYNLSGYRWLSSSIIYYYDNSISYNAQMAVYRAVSDWSGEDASLSFNAIFNIYCMDTYDSSVEWDGITYSAVDSANYFVSQCLLLNSAKPAWNSANALESVAAHEFGHCFGLEENPYTATIMNNYTYGPNSRYGAYGICTPQLDDRNGVNDIY
jgi:hypothetical protein